MLCHLRQPSPPQAHQERLVTAGLVARSRPTLFRLHRPLAQQPPAKPAERPANRSPQKLFRLRRRSRAPATRLLEESRVRPSAHRASSLHPHPSRAQAQPTAPQLERETPVARVTARNWRTMSFNRLLQSAQATAYRARAEKVRASVAPAIPARFSLLRKAKLEAATVPES
jgi:hypothetical protein